jgi:hypothetical protein
MVHADDSPCSVSTSNLVDAVTGSSSSPSRNVTYGRDEQEGDDPAASAEIHETSTEVTCLVHYLRGSNNR